MGKTAQSWREEVFSPERARTLKSRLFTLLRDELGLGREPKVARLLVDEIVAVIESTLTNEAHVAPGQLVVLAPVLGEGPSWLRPRLEDKQMNKALLTLIAPEDIEALIDGESMATVRQRRMARLVHEGYEQGVTLTSCQLAMMTGVSPSRVSDQLRTYMLERGEVLPMRGIIEDCSSAISHKTQIIALHLQGQTTSEIARATHHTPRSVERYVERFEQIRELAGHLGQRTEPIVIARLLGCSQSMVRSYLALMKQASS